MVQQACLLEKQMTVNARLRYLLHIPPAYKADEGRKWPLILFLHGAGERGDELQRVKIHGIAKIVEAGAYYVPDVAQAFITVSPQCPENSMWLLQAEALMAVLDEVIGGYAVDTSRIYLSGLSMGGMGTWALALTYPQRFAAIAPICGAVDWYLGFPARATVLKEMPAWVFHGAKDPVVPLEGAQRAVEALQACGGDVRLTVYPEAEHDSWTETYNNPALYAWLLSHRR